MLRDFAILANNLDQVLFKFSESVTLKSLKQFSAILVEASEYVNQANLAFKKYLRTLVVSAKPYREVNQKMDSFVDQADAASKSIGERLEYLKKSLYKMSQVSDLTKKEDLQHKKSSYAATKELESPQTILENSLNLLKNEVLKPIDQAIKVLIDYPFDEEIKPDLLERTPNANEYELLRTGFLTLKKMVLEYIQKVEEIF